MCMAVYAVSLSDSFELSFVLERIYQRRDGTTSITVDLLVHNLNQQPIKSIRILLPYAFVDIRKPGSDDIARAPEVFKGFQQKQLGKVAVRSEELEDPEHASNWVYRVLPHAKIDRGINKRIDVRRSGQSRGDDILHGFV